MIITQTPLRVSFLGGGTDYPEHFLEHGGAVLGTAVDKSAFFAVSRFYSRLFDYSIRISYRQVECVRTLDDIQHAPFRECLRWCGVTRDVEIDYMAELPAFTGLGSSSTFVVGLLNSLYAFQGRAVPPIELAYQAIELERRVLGEAVGCQDQTFAAVGGFNLLEFRAVDDIVVHRVPLTHERLREFEDYILILFTGVKRRSDELSSRQINNVRQNVEHLTALRHMVDEGCRILVNPGSLAPFGDLLHRAWTRKRELDPSISNGLVDEIYNAALDSGALGGKLLGAGGGGFILLFVPPDKRPSVCKRLSHLPEITIKLNAPGSRVIHA